MNDADKEIKRSEDMKNFKVYGYENLYMGARSGHISISIKPKGYWTDVIDIRITREYGSNAEWTKSISASSGGRDKDAVPCDIEAIGYFIEGLEFARTFAETFDTTRMEDIYQYAQQEDKA